MATPKEGYSEVKLGYSIFTQFCHVEHEETFRYLDTKSGRWYPDRVKKKEGRMSD